MSRLGPWGGFLSGGGEAGVLDGFSFGEPLAFEIGVRIDKRGVEPGDFAKEPAGANGGDGFLEVVWVIRFEQPLAVGSEHASYVLAERRLHEAVFGVFGLGPGVGKEEMESRHTGRREQVSDGVGAIDLHCFDVG